VGPAVADLLRYGIAATLTILTGLAMGYRPGGWLLTVADNPKGIYLNPNGR
jgi:ABC-2 type transport system permease protein